jgi:hypothetical protein
VKIASHLELARRIEKGEGCAGGKRRADDGGSVAPVYLDYRLDPRGDRAREGSVGAVRTVTSGFTSIQSRPADVRLDKSLGGGALRRRLLPCQPCLPARRP